MINIESLTELSNQCNEHLRESDRKRDSLLGIYISATLIILGFFSSNNFTFRISTIMWIFLGILVLAGTSIGILTSFYRAWHGLYVITIIALQEMIIHSRNSVSNDFICDIKFKFNAITSVEFFTFLFLHAFIALNLTVMFIFKSNIESNVMIQHNILDLISYSLFLLLFLEFITHFIVMIYFDSIKKRGLLSEKYLWMLYGRLIKTAPNIT